MTDDLKAALESLGADAEVRIVLQLGRPSLPEIRGSRADRVRALQDAAAKDKVSVLRTLREFRDRHPGLEYRGEGMFNHVLVRGPKSLIMDLPEMADVEVILPDRVFRTAG